MKKTTKLQSSKSNEQPFNLPFKCCQYKSIRTIAKPECKVVNYYKNMYRRYQNLSELGKERCNMLEKKVKDLEQQLYKQEIIYDEKLQAQINHHEEMMGLFENIKQTYRSIIKLAEERSVYKIQDEYLKIKAHAELTIGAMMEPIDGIAKNGFKFKNRVLN